MDLKNRQAVITGVSKGIGNALALQLLKEGAAVYGLGLNKPTNIIDHNFTFISTNVRRFEEVENAFNNIQGDIDILINNAGLGYFGFLEEMPLDQYIEMMETNVNGTFYCCRLALPRMKAKGEGHIFNISSTAGLEGMPQVSGYSATKHAVRGLSESLYKECRDFKIKVTCVYPGSVKTDFFRNSADIEPHDYMLMPEDVAMMIIQALKMPPNFHQVNLEIRPLQPKGPKK